MKIEFHSCSMTIFILFVSPSENLLPVLAEAILFVSAKTCGSRAAATIGSSAHVSEHAMFVCTAKSGFSPLMSIIDRRLITVSRMYILCCSRASECTVISLSHICIICSKSDF